MENLKKNLTKNNEADAACNFLRSTEFENKNICVSK